MSPQEQLYNLGKQLENLQAIMMNVQRLVAMKQGNGGKTYKIVPVLNISQEQIFYAYTVQHMSLAQIVELSGGKYSEQQLAVKIDKEAKKKGGRIWGQ